MPDPETATIADLFRLMNEVRSEVGSLRGEVRAKHNDLGQQVDATNAKIGALERRFGGMQTEIVGLSRGLQSQMEGMSRGVQSRIDGLGDTIAGMSDQLSTVGAILDGHTAQFRDVKDRVDKVSDRLDRVGAPL